MRHVEIGIAGRAPERALDLGLVGLGVFGRECRREPRIGAEVQDLPARRCIGDVSMTCTIERHLLGEIADAVLRPEALHHL